MTLQVSTFVEFPDKDEILARLRAIDIYEPLFDPLFELISERLSLKAYDRSAFVFILIELIYEFEEPTDRNFNELLSSAVLTLTDDADLVKAALDAFQEIKVTLEPENPADDVDPAQDVGRAEEDDEDDKAERSLPQPSIEDTMEMKVPVRMEDDEDEAGEDEAGEGGNKEPDGDDEALGAPAFDENEPVPLRLAVTEVSDDSLMDELQNVQKEIQDLGLSTRVLIEMTLSRPDAGNVSRAWREISAMRSALRRFEILLSHSEERILEAGGVLEKEE